MILKHLQADAGNADSMRYHHRCTLNDITQSELAIALDKSFITRRYIIQGKLDTLGAPVKQAPPPPVEDGKKQKKEKVLSLPFESVIETFPYLLKPSVVCICMYL